MVPRLARLDEERGRLAKKEERAQRRAAANAARAEREAARLAIGSAGGLGDYGGGRSRRGGQVDYTFSAYERQMKEAAWERA